MKNSKPVEISVCIPAHNESALIGRILENALAISQVKVAEILVCANGCSDDTARQVQQWAKKYPIIKLLEEKKASKINAWNRLVAEARSDILLFLDADIRFEPSSVTVLLAGLQDPQILLASGVQKPDKTHVSWKRFILGLTMLPLHQEYVYGGFYAFWKSALTNHLTSMGLNKMPKVIGEDFFLTISLSINQFCVAKKAIAYFQPPSKVELIRYFARINSQLIELEKHFPKMYNRFKIERSLNQNKFKIYKNKFSLNNSVWEAISGSFSAFGKLIFIFLYKRQIQDTIQLLLSKNTDSDEVLSYLTRSETSRKLPKLYPQNLK